MSANSIRLLMRRARERGREGETERQGDRHRGGIDLKKMLAKTLVVAVGPKTSNELQSNGVKVDIVPQNYTSEGVVEALKAKDLSRKTILVPRAKGASPYLTRGLRKLGARVEEFFIYQPALPSDTQATREFAKEISRGVIDAIVFTSSSTVRNFFKMMQNHMSIKSLKRLMNKQMDIVAIGPVTGRTLKQVGIKPKLVPRIFLADETVKALVKYYKSRRAEKPYLP